MTFFVICRAFESKHFHVGLKYYMASWQWLNDPLVQSIGGVLAMTLPFCSFSQTRQSRSVSTQCMNIHEPQTADGLDS